MIPFNKNSVILAPMAGVTDSAFRMLCIKYGADAVVSEMVSAKGIYYKDKKSYGLLDYSKKEEPISLQIFGSDTESIKVATEYITSNYSPASIDINMGCPAPKIFQNGDGCALMKNPELAYRIIKSAKDNTNIPVSVKFRSGVDERNINAVEFAKMCENAKADFITIHGRTREQFYSGESDLKIIKDVVRSVSIPVIANGDIINGKSAAYAIEFTGAHSVMVGRAALGNPLIFTQIKDYINKTGTELPTKLDVALEHLKLSIESKGEFIAVKEFRKHLMWYLKGNKNASKLKNLCCQVTNFNDCKKIIEMGKAE